MEGPLKIVKHLRQKVQSVTYGSPLYRMVLDQGGAPSGLQLSLPDLWPGDAEKGHALLASNPGLFDQDQTKNPSFFVRRATHSWLRDLRAVGSEAARRKAVDLLFQWLHDEDDWQDSVWAPGVLGARLTNWISFYDFYSPKAPDDLEMLLWPSMARQMRHLFHTLPVQPTGLESLAALKGCLYGGLAFMDREKALGLGFDLLLRQIDQEILPDGGHISRNPSLHLTFVRTLIDVREALRLAGLQSPPELALALQRMLPAIKFFRHGDGRFALFNGGREESAVSLDAVFSLSNLRCRALRRLDHMGYERLTAGRSLLLVDVGAAPPAPYDETAHAGLFGFEFSVGRERLIVNCGPGPRGDKAWHQAMAATAAHSTMTLNDMNACDVLSQGGLSDRAHVVDAQRYEKDGAHVVELSHDGYLVNLDTSLSRLLTLSADGELLQGREILQGPPGIAFSLRWHLHPSVQVSIIQDGSAALLRTPSGMGWRLSLLTDRARLELEPSIYAGIDPPRQTWQIKSIGVTNGRATIVPWQLTRENSRAKAS